MVEGGGEVREGCRSRVGSSSQDQIVKFQMMGEICYFGRNHG
jgi:hypothetical protein